MRTNGSALTQVHEERSWESVEEVMWSEQIGVHGGRRMTRTDRWVWKTTRNENRWGCME